MRVAVAPASEIPEGERKFFTIDDDEIVVLNVEGEYYAVRNLCPHQGGPVGRGPILHRNSENAIACPFHEWTFSLETGRSTGNYDMYVRTYEVEVEDGMIYVES